ncbi:MAG: hypothetical protein CMJ23_13350 [Phycisphaerae bacterium]|nr:hypothetical protein [Phycisphaerae bacterium]
MLNDSMIGRKHSTPQGEEDRRGTERTDLDVEVVVAWHFQPDQSVRYRSLDLSDTGMRIESSTPLLEGMTGVLVSILPQGKRIDRAVMVVWCRPKRDAEGHEAGLRFF